MAALERYEFRMNRHRALASCLRMIFFGKPVSTFPDHAPVCEGVEAGHEPCEFPSAVKDWRVNIFVFAME
jgi:hypothetical protein